MNRIIAAAITAAFVIAGLMTGCSELEKELITGSGNPETVEFEYSDFSRLEVGHSFEVDVSSSETYSLSVTVDDNLLDHLDVRKSGETLIIALDSGYNYRDTTQLATITMPRITEVKLSGASAADIGAFSSGNHISFRLSGASSADLENLQAGDASFRLSGASRILAIVEVADCEIDLSGASTITLAGSGDDLSADVSGASRLSLEDFIVNNARVNLSGASTGTVNSTGTLDASASGSSHLRYVGEPTLGHIDTSSSSSVSRQ